MSTSKKERGDLLTSNIWKDQTDCILDVRITNHGAPSNIHRKPQPFFPMSAKRKRKTSKPTKANAVTSLPLWFHVMECLEMKPRQYCKTLPEASPSLFPKPHTSLTVKSRMSVAIGRATHLCIRGSRIPTI